jgi:hypothetical protein
MGDATRGRVTDAVPVTVVELFESVDIYGGTGSNPVPATLVRPPFAGA